MDQHIFAVKVVNVDRVGGSGDHHRVAYILKDIEKFSEDQVAQILDITRQATKNRVHQARLVIRKRVEDRFFKTRH